MNRFVVFYKTWDDIYTHDIFSFSDFMAFIKSADYEFIFAVKEVAE